MSFNPNIPQPNDDLSDSQGDLLLNFQTSNASFGVDHYPFADLTSNNGYHNQVTTPSYVANPPTSLPPVTTISLSKFYAFEQTANLGLLQYSRGWDSNDAAPAVPTPLTSLHRTSFALAFNTPSNVLDFTGISRAIFTLYVGDLTTQTNTSNIIDGFWNGTTFKFFQFASSGTGNTSAIQAQSSTNILQIINVNALVTTNTVYWTLILHRLE